MNRKGFTSIELLVSFIIVSAIVVGLFDVILNYRNTQQIESYEMSIESYINSITKTIQDDLIKRKLIDVTITGYNAVFTFQNPDSKNQTTTLFSVNVSDASCTNCFIKYGAPSEEITYPLPNIADLTIQSVSLKNQNQFLVIDILLKHPNFENQKHIYLTAPINYTP